jgi:hypothetical protein
VIRHKENLKELWEIRDLSSSQLSGSLSFLQKGMNAKVGNSRRGKAYR